MYEQQYAMTMLILMTIMNVFFAGLMIFEIVPVLVGMTLAFVGMFAMIWKTKRDLIGNVKLWENAYTRRIIFGEWYAQDEANAANDEFRRGWRPVRRGWDN
mgnify:CR=1 FL=1